VDVKRKWYRTDERENTIDFLEATARFRAARNKHKWKWVAISIHGALYGFAILALKGTDPDRVVQKNKLISIHEALRRCGNNEFMLQYAGSQRLQMTESERASVQRLVLDLRNGFQHFAPRLWSVEIKLITEILEDVCRIIEFLALECGNVRLTPQHQSRISLALKRVRNN
jgi:hypothetical protein